MNFRHFLQPSLFQHTHSYLRLASWKPTRNHPVSILKHSLSMTAALPSYKRSKSMEINLFDENLSAKTLLKDKTIYLSEFKGKAVLIFNAASS